MDPESRETIGLALLGLGLLLLAFSANQMMNFIQKYRLNPFIPRATYLSLLTLYLYALAFSAIMAVLGFLLMIKKGKHRCGAEH
ncbi:MAG: hypothetical protein ACP5GO_04095 [Thermoprotei archaeon]|jgi:uncharacterized membrane protein YidH (DUF202 family)